MSDLNTIALKDFEVAAIRPENISSKEELVELFRRANKAWFDTVCSIESPKIELARQEFSEAAELIGRELVRRSH